MDLLRPISDALQRLLRKVEVARDQAEHSSVGQTISKRSTIDDAIEIFATHNFPSLVNVISGLYQSLDCAR